ncbi:hypothetical protein HX049_17140 [Myroides odoratimimus]|uniref:hypothetical protein n=1 Tax=Myroides odoratimimus TaxID=76832 RepID=UPI0025764598|nr:hypothetical protein [Myroides odoratimimus]MDM1398870.1 hypothetical protein [Myroides odoratimimus]
MKNKTNQLILFVIAMVVMIIMVFVQVPMWLKIVLTLIGLYIFIKSVINDETWVSNFKGNFKTDVENYKQKKSNAKK